MSQVKRDAEGERVGPDGVPVTMIKLAEDEVSKQGEGFVLKDDPNVRIDSRAFKMSKAAGMW